MRRGLALALFGALALVMPARADQPPRLATRAESSDGRSFAVLSHKDEKTTVYRKTTTGRTERAWEMRGYHPVVFLSDDPDYLVTAYRGGRLLSRDHKPDEVMLAFYQRGTLLRSIKLSELIPGPVRLPRTVSHLVWAESMGLVGRDRFRLLTADGREHLFDVTTGRTLSEGPTPPSSKVILLDSPDRPRPRK